MGLGRKLNDTLTTFIEKQPMFFVATAAPSGRVNVSPKGMDSLKVLSPTRVIWMNLSGSGNETAGHLKQLNRMTLMFCAFEGEALILRLYGTAKTLHPRDTGFDDLAQHFPSYAGQRQIFDMQIESLQTSCGSGVPFMEMKGQRGPDELVPFYDAMGEEGLRDYWQRKNVETIDGAPTGLFED